MLLAALLALSLQVPEYRAPDGREYFAQPDTGAVARAESALAADPRNVQRLIDLGLAQSAIRRYRDAIQSFSRGIQLAPDNPVLYRWRGHRFISVRQLDRAVADLVNGNSRDTANYAIWYHLGVAHYLRGEFDSAAVAFAHAKPKAPDEGERLGSYDWLWMSLMRAGRRDDAAASIADLDLDALARSTNAYASRLRLYRGATDSDHALRAADTTDIAVATVSYGIGNWLLLRGDTAGARTWFRRSLDSGGWPAFGFIASEMELRRLR